MTEVHFINVGYGDASLILHAMPDGRQFSMLIDCGGETVGGNPAGPRITAWKYIKNLGIGRIDIVLLTHLHLDHAGGLLQIAKHFAVGELWTNYIPHMRYWNGPARAAELCSGPQNLLKSLQIYTGALTILAANNTRIRLVDAGFSPECLPMDIRIVTGNPALYVRQSEILDDTFKTGADNDLLSELDGFINKTSLRAELHTRGFVFLFTGDIYASEWGRENISPADVVKIPHHGHTDSMNAAIAEKLKAKYAIISVSNARDDCPSRETVCILESAGARVLFTDAVKTPGHPGGMAHRATIFRIDGGGLHPEFDIQI